MEVGPGIVLIIVLCAVWQVQASVNCTAAGRFADPDDTTCQNYTLCVYDSSTGSYIEHGYVCPTTSVFNPNTSQCTASSNYVCKVTVASESPKNTSKCTAEGFETDPDSTNCTSYVGCVDVNGTFTETPYICPNGTYYNPNSTLCESSYVCPINSSSFNCTSAGRFANSYDSTCRSYYYCVLASNGTYMRYKYTCPSTSLFSPTRKICTTSYTCPASAPNDVFHCTAAGLLGNILCHIYNSIKPKI